MARTDPQLNFRIPLELRDRLSEAAKENNRSLTGELIARLEQSFGEASSGDGGATVVVPFDSAAALKRFADQLDKMMLDRHQAYRAEMIKEFGYDPDAPQIKREPNKGPVHSPNTKQPKK
ncbi:Arc family DNA-binding protein [Diaphorobacter sp. HDW4B]|uniref:Arc family DNA-binding protein n=1 Tax=Diaphorobacter sp. HDW4B TaxID=2714925 RepID=UPI0014074C0D|nr:Arc family DNA-binding protein [Diaphorobacter sp. HDW4B]QIL73277.1 Arc family DNA-binding protein [Diaphorobacter sp. HDW4B]